VADLGAQTGAREPVDAAIQDESIKLADVASGTATALRGDLHVVEDNNNRLDGVPACGGIDLSACVPTS